MSRSSSTDSSEGDFVGLFGTDERFAQKEEPKIVPFEVNLTQLVKSGTPCPNFKIIRGEYELAVNEHARLAKLTPPCDGTEMARATAAVAKARVQAMPLGYTSHQLASDTTTVLGYTPFGFNKENTLYTHPRFASELHEESGKPSTTLEDVVDSITLTLHKRTEHHSLWGHLVWNSALYTAKRILLNDIDVRGKRVLEVGAGLGIPSIVAALHGANMAIVSDYPEDHLIEILKMNAEANVWKARREQNSQAKAENTNGTETIEEEKEETESAELPMSPPKGANLQVMPLLWGNQDHIKEAMRRVHNAGFDVIILSDVLFNHVCTEDLLKTVSATLSKDRSAAAYVIFNHHRPHRMFEDLQFFEKCELFGLDFVKMDEQHYPVMFPNDPGPTEIRMPVHCFKIFHRLDEAGLPLDPFAKFDVVVQGTGMTESFVSAALARAGKKVLHVDAAGTYGGSAFSSIDLGAFHRQYATPLNADGTYSDGYKRYYGATENCFHEIKGKLKVNRIIPTNASSHNVPEAPLTERELRQVVIDAAPLFNFSRGPLINTLVDGNAGRNLEFMTVDRVALLEGKGSSSPTVNSTSHSASPSTVTTAPTAGGATLAARRALLAAKKLAKSAVETVTTATSSTNEDKFTPRLVPFSRSDVFKRGSHLFSNPLEARRVMKFIKDLEKSFAHTAEDSGNENELDKRVQKAKAAEGLANVESEEENDTVKKAHSQVLAADGETMRRALPWEDPAQDQSEPLEVFLTRHYGLSPSTIEMMTLGGGLVPYTTQGASATTSYTLSSAIDLIRTSLASVHRFGVGDTPFISCMYGSGEIPQNMCRISAVWDATFILRRCVRSVSYDDHRMMLRLSNGQRIEASALVVPKELMEYRPAVAANNIVTENAAGGLLRAVMVLSQPLLSWAQLEQRCNDFPATDDSTEKERQQELREMYGFPILLGVLKAAPSAGNNAFSPPIIIHQIGACTGHAPQSVGALGQDDKVTVLHFSADAKEISREAFEAAIDGLIHSGLDTTAQDKPDEPVPNTDTSTQLEAAQKDEESKEAQTDTGRGTNAPAPPLRIPLKTILYYATFELSAETVAANTCGGASYRPHITPPKLLALSEELAAADVGDADKQATDTAPVVPPKAPIFYSSSLLAPSTANPFRSEAVSTNSKDASRSKDIASLKASAVCSLLNDGSYVCEALSLYNSIMAHLLTFGKDDWATCDQSEYRRRDEEKAKMTDGAALATHSESSGGKEKVAADTPSQQWMPFLYKLPDPTTGRDGDGSESDNETHATYAQKLLSEAATEPS